MAARRDPLQFAYVHLWLNEEEDEREELYKVFYADGEKVKLREITYAGGVEQERDALWVPWRAIMTLREVNGPAT